MQIAPGQCPWSNTGQTVKRWQQQSLSDVLILVIEGSKRFTSHDDLSVDDEPRKGTNKHVVPSKQYNR